ncbi:MAG: Vms1/Ankzf1 family peptidyl-tRNA hydrolase [Planctomycetota bacterium]|nr:Vms1/Ankzf1 family peptidyl-tRNA hydrolase [Planctomycetota bacterium]
MTSEAISEVRDSMEFIERDDLEILARVKADGSVFISLFLSTSVEEKSSREMKTFLRKKVRQFEKMFASKDKVRTGFRRSLEQIEEFVENGLSKETRGLAIFCSAERSFFRAFQLSVRLPNRFIVDETPHIAPLAQLVENHQHHLVVLLDSHHARILGIYFWRVIEEKRLEEEIPGKVKVGGWSQPRFQRHRRDQVQHFLKEVADQLEKSFRKDSPDNIILLGQGRIMAEFRKLLPRFLDDKVLIVDSMDITTSSQDVVRRLRPLLEEEKARSHQEVQSQLLHRVREDYLAVGGVGETLGALQEGRVDALILASQSGHMGVRCRGCGFLFEKGDQGDCLFCKEELEDVDLTERMVEMAEKGRSAVEFIQNPEPRFLEAMDGVGAFLKY